jgi:hypothetical protein
VLHDNLFAVFVGEIAGQTERAAFQLEQCSVRAPPDVIELDRTREGARTIYWFASNGVTGCQQQDAEQYVNYQIKGMYNTSNHGRDYNQYC